MPGRWACISLNRAGGDFRLKYRDGPVFGASAMAVAVRIVGLAQFAAALAAGLVLYFFGQFGHAGIVAGSGAIAEIAITLLLAPPGDSRTV